MFENLKNFFLISEKMTYIIKGSPETSSLMFYSYKDGVKTPVARIYETDGHLLLLRKTGEEVILRILNIRKNPFMPVVGAKNKLFSSTSNSTFIVWNNNYSDRPVSSAVIFIRNGEMGNIARILCTVCIADGELAFDFINDNKEELL